MGHVYGQVVGSYKIIPNNSDQVYSALLTRYGPNGKGGFAFAIPLLHFLGSNMPTPIPASTMNPATNWGEIANPSSLSQDALITIRDRHGKALYEKKTTIQPHAQHHVYINQILGDNKVGTFDVSCADVYAEDCGFLVQGFTTDEHKRIQTISNGLMLRKL